MSSKRKIISKDKIWDILEEPWSEMWEKEIRSLATTMLARFLTRLRLCWLRCSTSYSRSVFPSRQGITKWPTTSSSSALCTSRLASRSSITWLPCRSWKKPSISKDIPSYWMKSPSRRSTEVENMPTGPFNTSTKKIKSKISSQSPKAKKIHSSLSCSYSWTSRPSRTIILFTLPPFQPQETRLD